MKAILSRLSVLVAIAVVVGVINISCSQTETVAPAAKADVKADVKAVQTKAVEPKKEEPKKADSKDAAPAAAAAAGPAEYQAYAKKSSVPTLFVPKIDKLPDIDGVMDEVYKKATPIAFKFLAGGDAKPAAKTTAYVVSTATELVLFFKCETPDLSALVAEVRDHDGQVFQDDSLELFIDPANKREMDSYMHIMVNSLGTTAESKGPSGAEDFSWDPKMKVKAKVDRAAKAWFIEMVIPFKDLVANPDKMSKVWAVNFNRMAYLVEGNEDTAWSPTGGSSSHVPTKFGALWLEVGAVDNSK